MWIIIELNSFFIFFLKKDRLNYRQNKKSTYVISVSALVSWWAQLGSNQRPTGYEPVALPLSYRPIVPCVVSMVDSNILNKFGRVVKLNRLFQEVF